MLDPLSELFREYGSDKGGEHLKAGDTCHNYGIAYDKLFSRRRHQVEAVLEIGISHGCSLRAWRDYFPRALIFGLDNNPTCLFEEARIKCYLANQANSETLNLALGKLLPYQEKRGLFDLIVDDGSHEAEHQVSSAVTLLPYLKRNGYYVIEDIHFDCKPELIGDPIVEQKPDFMWYRIPTGHGIGRAHCECGCGEGEQLVVLRWKHAT